MVRFRRLASAIAATAIIFASPAFAWGPKLNQPAPAFHVTTMDGRELSLDDFKGQVVVLNFWATWCVPCREELPLLDGYYKMQKKYGLQILAVTTEDSAPLSKLRPVAQALAFPMVRRLKGPYRVLDGVPTNYIIDRAGILRYAKADAFSLDDLNRLLVPLLREPPPEAPPPATVASAASTRP